LNIFAIEQAQCQKYFMQISGVVNMQIENLFRPSEEDLKVFKKIDDIYDQGLGDEFEIIVRRALARQAKQGLDLKADFYALADDELPSMPRRDIFRRLCSMSPCEPIGITSKQGRSVTAQLIERNDFERILKALIKLLTMGFGCNAKKRTRTESAFEMK
jgi:hypothetical protein